jgi:Domain of unknown function (DUF1996)
MTPNRSRGRVRAIALSLAVALTAVALAAPVVAAATGAARTVAERVAERAPAGNGLFFRSVCTLSHTATDDPIVHPGMEGMSHSHEFFGNTTTNADSTLSSLLGQPTTCRIAGDTAAYWVPTLYDDGVRVAPSFVFAYYFADGARGSIRPFPAGLKVIAGDSRATTPQSTRVVGWKCASLNQQLSADPIACPGSHAVLVHNFPDCWDGRNLDSADHKSHLAYRTRGQCPTTHPVALPQLSLRIHYRLPSTTGLTLAAGSIYAAHADFFNAWDQGVLTRLVNHNLN